VWFSPSSICFSSLRGFSFKTFVFYFKSLFFYFKALGSCLEGKKKRDRTRAGPKKGKSCTPNHCSKLLLPFLLLESGTPSLLETGGTPPSKKGGDLSPNSPPCDRLRRRLPPTRVSDSRSSRESSS